MKYASNFVLIILLSIKVTFGLTVALRNDHKVEKEFLMLSDFFDGVPKEKDQEILEAPEHGTSKHYPHTWVRRLAQNFGLYWAPINYKGITLTHQHSLIKRFDIKKAIKEYVSQNHADKTANDMDVILDYPANYEQLNISEDVPKLVNFSWLDNKRFIVIFDAKGNDIKVRGSISKIVYLPVLNKTISPGQIIQKEDIEYTSFPEHKIANNVVQNEEALIGKTLRRRIMNAGDILNINDVVSPIVIKRGDLVTMRVENSSFIITARGKAQGSAAIGETVQVMNLESKRLIDGIVKDSQTVMIPVVSR